MGECRFDVSGFCHEHNGSEQVLCDHAAADLEGRLLDLQKAEVRYLAGQEVGDERIRALESRLACMNEARATAEALVLSHEGHITTLEEEKARLVARTYEQARLYWREHHAYEAFEARLAQAEARVAAVRAWIEDWLNTPFFEGRADWEQWVVSMRQTHALLSPAAGRAPKHVCGASGFGASGDVCPACEADKVKRDALGKQGE